MKFLSAVLGVLFLVLSPVSGEEGWLGDGQRGLWIAVGENQNLDKILTSLRGLFPSAKFEKEEGRQGFYVSGTINELGEVVSSLRKKPKVVAHLPIRDGLDPEATLAAFRQRFPEVQFRLERPPAVFQIEGSPEALDQVRELLSFG